MESGKKPDPDRCAHTEHMYNYTIMCVYVCFSDIL